jgi:hypothetical protein
MKEFIKRYFIIFPIVIFLGLSLFSHSCANTTQAPTGGPKDTIPPVLVKISPLPGSKNVPTHGTRVYFGFDEYVKVSNGTSIYLSPPQKKAPKYKIKGKGVLVYFEEDLLPNTTYTLDITNAIQDNNEGNNFPGYTTVFSTGENIDSMMITGTVMDCNTLLPIKDATVMLYKNQEDSAVFKERPFASTKTDDWGYFVLRNIKDTTYRLYAIVDANNNNVYDPDEDRIAFQDSLIKPLTKVNDSLPELKKYDMKDTALCLARKSDFELRVFKERPSKQMLMNSKRTSARSAYITFMAPDAKIDSLWFYGFPATEVITKFNQTDDSLLLWLNDQRRMPDTLKLGLVYWKTDSTGTLQPKTERVDLVDENMIKNKHKRIKIEHADTVCALKLTAVPEKVEAEGFLIKFDYPPIIGKFDSLKFWSINPRQKQQNEKFTYYRDKDDITLYHITPKVTFQSGWEYMFKIPERVFKDINNHWNDSTEVKVSLPTDETLSSLTMNITGVKSGSRYIIDLLDEKRSNVLRTIKIETSIDYSFKYLAAGKYSLRVTEDRNKNDFVDTGSLLEHKQPEKVIFVKFNGSEYLNIPEKSDIVQDIDFKELFK